MESKRIRFGLTYKGGVRFVKEALNGVQVRSIECVSVNELHYVLVTTHRPCTISRISEALKGYNETAEARLELESFNGDDVVTFSKAQGYMQHLFYAPFALAKKSEEGGGQSSYWCWNAEEDSTNTKKRASKELQSDFVESVVTPSEKKRASVTPTREQAALRKRKSRKVTHKQPVTPAAKMIPVDVVYEMAKCKDETIKAKNYTIQLLESMLQKPKLVVEAV